MPEPDPDQLLKSLDAQLAQMKARRSRSGLNRNAVRVLSIVIFLIGLIASLALLQYMASELPRPAHSETPAPESGR